MRSSGASREERRPASDSVRDLGMIPSDPGQRRLFAWRRQAGGSHRQWHREYPAAAPLGLSKRHSLPKDTFPDSRLDAALADHIDLAA